jgi:hypothetical protein
MMSEFRGCSIGGIQFDNVKTHTIFPNDAFQLVNRQHNLDPRHAYLPLPDLSEE